MKVKSSNPLRTKVKNCPKDELLVIRSSTPKKEIQS